ncbi:MAG: mechanosensitive ion channel [Acetobacteraceae bacterium]|nr:mechanosensitive ion channel [Acetobacteraceae bacterium]
MPRISFDLIFAAVSIALWWFRDLALRSHLFSSPSFVWFLDAAAAITTAVVAVTIAERVCFRVVVLVYGAAPSGFQRAGLYAVMSAVGTAAVLTHLGVNVTTVIATSATVTVIVGLALQPTLGALVSGLTLQTDRVLRIGDAIVQNGQLVVVTAFNWRSVSGVKLDGTAVVVPTGQIVDHVLEICRRDQPVRADTTFPAPITVPPHRVSELICDLVADFPQVDNTQPISVAPVEFSPDHATTCYRIRYWMHPFSEPSDLEPELLRRVWYALHREGFAWPVNRYYEPELRALAPPAELLGRDWADAVAIALAHASAQDARFRLGGSPAEAIADTSTPLFFTGMERIVIPGRLSGAVCLLVSGEAVEITSELEPLPARNRNATTPKAAPGPGGSQAAALKRIGARLADVIGPYAEIAVRRAARESSHLSAVCERVAQEIAHPAERASFMQDVLATEERRHGPGLVLHLRRGPSGDLLPEPALRASSTCAVIAIRPATLAAYVRAV